MKKEIDDSVKKELKSIVIDIASQGYNGLLSDDNSDKWIDMYVEALIKISKGDPYTKDMMDTICGNLK